MKILGKSKEVNFNTTKVNYCKVDATTGVTKNISEQATLRYFRNDKGKADNKKMLEA